MNKVFRDSHGLPVLVRCSAKSGLTKHCCIGFPLPDGSYVACGVPLRCFSGRKVWRCASCSGVVRGMKSRSVSE
jgi:hypothetical protein